MGAQVGVYVEIRLDKDVIQALQLGINAYTVRDAIVASKLKVKPPHVTCAPFPPPACTVFSVRTALSLNGGLSDGWKSSPSLIGIS